MNLAVLITFALCGSVIVRVSSEESYRVRQKRADDSSPLAAVVQTLSQQVSENNAKIAALEAKLSKL